MVQRIADISWVAAESAYFRDDQAAVRTGAPRDGFLYRGRPVTPGFRQIREPGQALRILLRLTDGAVVAGDCVQVQYTGVAGRAAPLSVMDGGALADGVLRPLLAGREVSGFRRLCGWLRAADLPPWLLYGASQCALRAAAHVTRRTMTEVILAEWDLPQPHGAVPVMTQGGDGPLEAVDRMILKRADALPHGLINNVATRLGARGEKLSELVRWLRDRIGSLVPDPFYRPVLHFDVYGTLGDAFGDLDLVADYLHGLERTAFPYRLRIEHPINAADRRGQIEVLAALRRALAARASRTEIVADEWCNTLPDITEFATARCADMIHIKTPDLGGLDDTVEALLVCRRAGVGAYCGGTCNETVASAQACTQVALACGADLLLAKPGMGVDEGLSIVRNEMRTVLAIAALRNAPSTVKEAYTHEAAG